MTTSKDLDNMSEEEFQKLIKFLNVQPQKLNSKQIPTYCIKRKGLIYGFIGIKEFEYRIEHLER